MPIYMKFEGIVGPLKGKHAGWIELESCELGNSRHNAGSASRSEKPHLSDITITKHQDSTSTALFREATSGSPKKVIIDFVNDDGAAYMTLELDSTMIGGLSISGRGNADALESMSLNFTNISFKTKAAAPAADANSQNAQAAWNMAAP